MIRRPQDGNAGPRLAHIRRQVWDFIQKYRRAIPDIIIGDGVHRTSLTWINDYWRGVCLVGSALLCGSYLRRRGRKKAEAPRSHSAAENAGAESSGPQRDSVWP